MYVYLMYKSFSLSVQLTHALNVSRIDLKKHFESLFHKNGLKMYSKKRFRSQARFSFNARPDKYKIILFFFSSPSI